MLVLAIYMLALNGSSAQHVSLQEAKRDAEIAGVKFAVPKDFKLESVDARVAFMRHETSKLALFLAVPQQQVSDQYLNDLSHTLVRKLLPQQNGFAWKVLPRKSDRKVSVNQTGEGTVKGLNAKQYVQADYVVLKSNGRALIVGSIAPFGDERSARFLFDVEGSEYSFAGWGALFHLIASITGERIDCKRPNRRLSKLVMQPIVDSQTARDELFRRLVAV
jgi:hypothetical protein